MRFLPFGGRRSALACLASLVFASPAAATTTIDFDGLGLGHGDVITTELVALGISSFTVTNIGGGPDLGIIFDSLFVGATTDPDLLGPAWAVGNLAPGTVLGDMLIIQENSTGCGDLTCDDPDDEGTRPAGSFEFIFSTSVDTFGFDIIDVESVALENGSIVFHDGGSTFTILWSDFEAGSGSAFEVLGMVFGDNSANRVPEISAAAVGLTQFDKIVINMGGSGAIDNLVVPEPATASLVLLGTLTLAVLRRRL